MSLTKRLLSVNLVHKKLSYNSLCKLWIPSGTFVMELRKMGLVVDGGRLGSNEGIEVICRVTRIEFYTTRKEVIKDARTEILKGARTEILKDARTEIVKDARTEMVKRARILKHARMQSSEAAKHARMFLPLRAVCS